MTRIQLIITLLCSLTCGVHAQTNAAFAISYWHAGLTRIEVKDGKLLHTWHTERKTDDALALPRQSMSNFDRHEVEIWLTSQELGRFRQWADTNHFERLKSPFRARPGGQTYGSAFHTSLTVVLEGSRQGADWNGDAEVPSDLLAAERELLRLCSAIAERRNK